MTTNHTFLTFSPSRFITPVILLSLNILLVVHNASAQLPYANWYFGDKAGITFITGAPVAVTNGQMVTQEGCASISDTNGDLLFYTDGVKVWDRNHALMPNGTGLLGNFSSTQSAVIVQKPNSNNIFYIFTSDCQNNNNGISYSEVDMNLNNGMGDVNSNKNILLYGPADEKLCYTYHCNGEDIWVISHERNTTNFYAYLVTANGVSSSPVISAAGLLNVTGVGYLKVSPDGKKIASAEHTSNRTQLFDFNNVSGVVSNGVVFPQFSAMDGAYGLEFSTNGTKLYVACPHNTASIYQFNMCAGSNTAIVNSGIQIGTSASSWIGCLQLGPDGKIYIARYLEGKLAIINNPELSGNACNFVDDGIYLAGKFNRLGLPNNIYARKIDVPAVIPVVQNCDTAKFNTPVFSLTDCSSSFDPLLSVSWNFNDPLSGLENNSSGQDPVHVFSEPGTYTVQMILNFDCRTDTLVRTIIVSKPAIEITAVSPHCSESNGSVSATAISHIPITSYTWEPGGQNTSAINGLSSGSYTVTVCDSLGCTQSLSATLSGTTTSLQMLNVDTAISIGDEVQLNASGGIHYIWTPANNLSCTTCPSPVAKPVETTHYCVTATDSSGCTLSKCIDIIVDVGTTYIPNSFTPNGDNLNDVFFPVVPPVHDFNLQIYNRWGNLVYTSDDPKSGWNGMYQGKMCTDDVYAYTLVFKDDLRNKSFRYAGKIQLVR